MEWPERITADPEILAGKPVIQGTGLTVEFILELLASGQTEAEVLYSYPGLTRQDILACVAFGANAAKQVDAKRKARFVHWQDGQMWLGYLEEFPDYMTQGESIEELEENLRDLHRDLTSGEIPGVRRVAELSLG